MKYKIKELEFSIPSYEYFELIKNNDWAVYLNSNNNKYHDQRYDILSSNPINKIILSSEYSSSDVTKDNIFNILEKNINMHKCEEDDDIPFCGGAIGFMSYDFGNTLHNIKNKKNKDFDYPLAAFGIYDWCITYDYLKEKSFILYYEKNNIISKILNHRSEKNEIKKYKAYKSTSSCESNMNYDLYKSKISKISNYIKSGDCYQVNFAQRFSLGYEGDEYSMYKTLNKSFASPYSAYINYPFGNILSFSPERFLSIKNNLVETKPIKGTRPRSDDEVLDKKNLDELRLSDKDKAENLMIVDLLRNDLGKICKMNSIKVEELYHIKTFKTINHMVSKIIGKLNSNVDEFEIIKALFPGGSITGAPKESAMKIIDAIESKPRNIYTGSIGYIKPNGDMSFNISIRTLLNYKNQYEYGIGGGIVWDSDENDEWNEAQHKSKILSSLIK